MPHAENILALLDAQRCIMCGGQAVRGSKVCLPCAERMPASEEDDVSDVIYGTIGPHVPSVNQEPAAVAVADDPQAELASSEDDKKEG